MPGGSPPDPTGSALVDPDAYARDGYPWQTFAWLRRESPIHFFDREDVPFWALTRHSEIVEVSRRPDLYSNLPHFQINLEAEFGSGDEREPETIIQMDPPRHRRYRELISRRFTPRALAALETELEPIADSILDDLAHEATRGECDFVAKVAAPFPIAVIAWLLGLPREDWPQLYDWTNAVVMSADPEFRNEGENPQESRLRASKAIYDYFDDLSKDRRDGDGTDLVSLLARARVDDAPLDHHELVSYYMLLVAAGNETTRNAISGGLLAFIEHPEAWEALRNDPGLLRLAAEEILRWTTPVIQMARTALQDVELGGQEIRAGDTLGLFYASANRDETIRPEPTRFRLDRHPNPHLSFGVGEHFCVGAHLARIEIRTIFRLLTRRLQTVELLEPPTRARSATVGGIKRLRIGYALDPSPSMTH